MVLPSARRFTELGVQPRKPLEDSKTIDEAPREPAASDTATDIESPAALSTPAERSSSH